MAEFHSDGTIDCACGLPMFPMTSHEESVRYECANRHVQTVLLPDDRPLRRLIQNWVDRRSGQIDEQHRRWEGEDSVKPD